MVDSVEIGYSRLRVPLKRGGERGKIFHRTFMQLIALSQVRLPPSGHGKLQLRLFGARTITPFGGIRASKHRFLEIRTGTIPS
jgi:hypothetical protein